jgi:hypothetical protein
MVCLRFFIALDLFEVLRARALFGFGEKFYINPSVCPRAAMLSRCRIFSWCSTVSASFGFFIVEGVAVETANLICLFYNLLLTNCSGFGICWAGKVLTSEDSYENEHAENKLNYEYTEKDDRENSKWEHHFFTSRVFG